MIAVTDAGPVNPTLTSSRSGCTVDAAPGGEPTSSILSRARPALDAWAEQAQACDHTLIVVTHDAVIRPLQINIARQPSLCPTWPPASTNCCDAIQTTWRIERANQLPLMPPAAGRQSSCAASLLKALLRKSHRTHPSGVWLVAQHPIDSCAADAKRGRNRVRGLATGMHPLRQGRLGLVKSLRTAD